MDSLEKFAKDINVTVDDGMRRMTDIGMGDWDFKKGSMHFLYFAMASLVIDVKNILELGTGLGESTTVLSKLYPIATVYTLDLPPNDLDYEKISWRNLKLDRVLYFKVARERDNVRFIESNSFFLPMLDLPKKFELIWVDGGHQYPVVAWDIMYAYNHLKNNGFLFMHDYSTITQKPGGLKVKAVLDYITSRIKEEVWLLQSRLDSTQHKHAKTACIRRLH